MIHLDRLSDALVAADPSLALDTLVRKALSAGRSPGELFDELKAAWPEVSSWPEYRGEAEADWHGMMDALRGWCHPDCRYGSPAPHPANGHPIKETARV